MARAGESFRIATPDFELVWGADDAPPLPPGHVPRLREQTAYPVFLRTLRGPPAALEHRDPLVLRPLRVANGGRMTYGAIDFGSQVGRSTFAIRSGGAAVSFEVEVVPTKLDYEADHRALVDDTQDLLTGLALEYLRATFYPGTPVPVERPGHVEWLTLLRHAADDLESALEHVARHPERGMRREAQPTRAERVRRPDAALLRAVRRGAGAGGSVPAGAALTVRERVGEQRAAPALDTAEHRWIAAQLRAIRRRIARVIDTERAHPPTPRRDRVLAEAAALAGRVGRWERREPFASAAGDPPPGFASPQLLHAPGYREAHRACRILAMGLRVHGGPAELALRDLHLLYEQWCYLALARIVAGLTGAPLPATHLLVADDEGMRARLRRGWESAARWELADGARVSLVYNPRFDAAAILVPQQPDVLLEIHRPGRAPARVVLDAKYRLDTSPEYAARYGGAGPPEDALNTLHRYRDALGAGVAVALFPGAAAPAGRLHPGARGIGALPFLPSSTGAVEEWLRALLAE